MYEEGPLYNVGSKQLGQLMRQPDFPRALMQSGQSYQVAADRIATAKWSPESRIVYSAIRDGYTSMDTLPVATGLSNAQIAEAMKFLSKGGYISPFVAEDVNNYFREEEVASLSGPSGEETYEPT
jgi:hypothetical protein